MDLIYHSTRNTRNKVTASQAILQGLSPDGGLFVPEVLPKLDKSIKEMSDMNYQTIAYEVMKLFLTDYTEEELKDCISKAYDKKFDTLEIAPIKKVGKDYYLELFHGATLAFKDMALSILPHLLTKAAKKNNIKEEIVILTATSGDTGKAALAGFADVQGTRIVVFYPKDGVSPLQEKQMVTQKGDNTSVIGIRGNFDDAQTGVKKIFANTKLSDKMQKAGYRFSSANSINIGRLIPQIVYYVYAYVHLFKNKEISKDEQINIVVPTGNFGNILAAYYAKKIGIPINKLICASNENKVLYDFFSTGVYDKNREFYLTSSPSMDILVSSNLERLIYHVSGEDSEKTAQLMKSLQTKGSYEITETMKENLNSFVGGWASVADTRATINNVFKKHNYIIDTHTAVAAKVHNQYTMDTSDESKAIIVSTASPYKFVENVLDAIEVSSIPSNDYEQAKMLEKLTGVNVPMAVEELKDAPVIHNKICEVMDMQVVVEELLGIN